MAHSLPNRLLLALIVHIVIAALLTALLWWISSDAKTLIAAASFQSCEDTIDRETARLFLAAALRNAGLAAVLVSLVCTAVWLAICEANPPAGNVSAAAQRGSWTGMFFGALIGAGGAIYATLWGQPRVLRDLFEGVATNTTISALIAVAVAYYLATALAVRRAQRVSVPGAPALFGN